MKKLLSIVCVFLLLMSLTSCNSRDYSTIEMPVKGLYWGMSLEEAEKVLKEQGVSYEIEDLSDLGELGDSGYLDVLTVKLEENLYGMKPVDMKFHFWISSGLCTAFAICNPIEEEELKGIFSSKLGEFQEEELNLQNDEFAWTYRCEETAESFQNKELLEEVERYYLEYDLENPNSEGELETVTKSPLVTVEIHKGKDEFETSRILIAIDGVNAAILKQIETLGAEGYYNKLLENKE